MQVQNGWGWLGLLRLEFVPGRNELVRDDVAQLLDVPQALFQSLDGGCALCAALVWGVGWLLRVPGRTVGLDSDVHLGLRRMWDGIRAKLNIGAAMNVSDTTLPRHGVLG